LASSSRVAFCGSLDEFRTQFPERVSQSDKPEESTSETEAPKTSTASFIKKSVSLEKGNSSSLVAREEEMIGAVPFCTYRTYMNAAGGVRTCIGVVLGVVVGQSLQTGGDAWVSYWSDHSVEDAVSHISSSIGVAGYAFFSVMAFSGIICANAFFRFSAMRASRSFHRQLLDKTLRLPMAFFDTTPLGRVLNRFSNDIYTIDEKLQSVLNSFLTTLMRVTATVVVIIVATPWFVVIIIPLLVVYRWTQNYFIPANRQLKRIESNLKSPIFSHFAECLEGAGSIRAFAQQDHFIGESVERVGKNMRANYINFSSNRWLAVRLEALGTLIVTSAGMLAVVARDSISAGVAGLSLSYALSVTQSLNWFVRMTADRETNIVSVERVQEYIDQPAEPPHWQPDQDPPMACWPQSGVIEFHNIKFRYRPGLPLVLDDMSLKVEAHEKLGICGRTGAGKSSMLNILLRIVDPELGRVVIDDIDIAKLGLARVRRGLTVIPQDPVLFSGTLRFNLDPLALRSDEDILTSLRRAHLSAHVQSLSTGSLRSDADGSILDFVVEESGRNFSLGQRQQMCLARAMLRSSCILLLDEATSAVDIETDSLIQKTIREEFSKHTILCIAHRISTIMSSDRVCVLDHGKIVSLGSPNELLQDPNSHFSQLAELDSSRH